MLCQDCDKKPTCTKLCEQAQQYVNQDYVPRTECLPGDAFAFTNHTKATALVLTAEHIEILSHIRLTPKQEEAFFMYYQEVMTTSQIAGVFGITHQGVSYRLKAVKKKLWGYLQNHSG
jgi:DNA-directed RNA polymerase specialized sigma24 family protein